MKPVIFLSPSRQRSNTGAGEYGREILRMNQIANVAEFELERRGILVEREGQEVDVYERCQIANDAKMLAYLSLHSNSASYGRGSIAGTEIYISRRNAKSALLAEAILSRLAEIPNFLQGKILYHDSYAETALPAMPSCLIEIDYHSHPERAKWIVEQAEDIGKQICAGVICFLDLYTDFSAANMEQT